MLRTEDGFHQFISEYYSVRKITLLIQTFYFQNIVVPNLQGFRTAVDFKHIVGSNDHHWCRSWNCFSWRPPRNQCNGSFFQWTMTLQDYNDIIKTLTSGTASLQQLPCYSISIHPINWQYMTKNPTRTTNIIMQKRYNTQHRITTWH